MGQQRAAVQVPTYLWSQQVGWVGLQVVDAYVLVEYGSKPLKSAWQQSWDHATGGAAAMCAGQLCSLRR